MPNRASQGVYVNIGVDDGFLGGLLELPKITPLAGRLLTQNPHAYNVCAAAIFERDLICFSR